MSSERDSNHEHEETGFRRRQLYGMRLHLDRRKSLDQLVGRLHQVTCLQAEQVATNLERHSITLIHGTASFEDERTVAVP